MPTDLERHPIHPALYRPVLFAGLPRPILIIEGSITLAFTIGLGLQWVTLGFLFFMMVVVHPLLVTATRKDPDMLALFVRNFRHSEYYDAVPAYRAPKLRTYSSIPKV